MKQFTIIAAFAVLLAACGQSQPDAPSIEFADLVVVNADVRTSDPVQPQASAFAVRAGRFIAIGGDSDIESLTGPETTRIDANGASVTPGLIDGHVHLTSGLSLVRGVNLYGIPEKAEWLRMIAERDAELPEGQWILGGRWDHTLTDSPLPTREELDAVVPDRPVFLSDVDGHSRWANSLALELAGVNADSVSPEGGRILKHPDTGEPTGILLETASRLVSGSEAFAQGTAMSDDERRAALAETLRFANSLGITGAHEMSGFDTFEDYAALLESGDLTVRIWQGTFSPSLDPADFAAMKAHGVDAQDRPAFASAREAVGPMLELGYIKFLIDGVLSTHTATLIEPYADRPDETGLPVMTQDAINARVAAANEGGFPVAIHAIGDGGVRMALDAFVASDVKPDLPNRIEHIELIHPADIDRFAEENVVASMNPHHAVTTFHNYLTERIGEAREPYAYAWKTLQDSGATVVLGSDWATAPLSPFEQLWSATFRESAFGRIRGPWHAENALGFDEALYGYTQAPANISGWGDELGSITVGKWADFVIVDGAFGHPLNEDLRGMKARATYIAGQAVYEAE